MRFRKDRLPPPRTFYEKEFRYLRRSGRNQVITFCCFHPDKRHPNLSLNLVTGAFHCWACGASGGDVVDFLQFRYHLNFADAAKQLPCWDNSRSVTAAEVQALDQARAQREQQEETARQERISARARLHCFEAHYAVNAARLTELRRGAPEKFKGETEYCWLRLSTLLPQIRAAESVYRSLAGLGGAL